MSFVHTACATGSHVTPRLLWLAGVVVFFVFLPTLLIATPQVVAADEAPARIVRMEAVVEVGDDNHAYLDCRMEFEFLRDAKSLDFVHDTSSSRGFSLQRVEISEGSIGRERNTQALAPLFGAGQNAALTYEVKQSQSRLDLKIHMLAEAAAVRTVRLRFLMYGAVAAYQDVADLNLPLPELGYAVESFHMQVRARRGIIPLQAYGNGAAGLAWEADKQSGWVDFRAAHIPANTALRIRCLYPPELVGDRGTQIDEPRLAELIASEAALATTLSWADSIRASMPWIRWLMLALVPLLMGVFFWFPSARRRRRDPDLVPTDRSLLPPAMAELFCHRRLDGRSVVAAIYDLAARGVLRATEEGYALLWDQEQLGALAEHDRYLIGWLSTTVGEAGVFRPSLLVDATGYAQGGSFRQSFATYRQLVRARFRRSGWIDRGAEWRCRVLAWSFCALYVLAAGVMVWLEAGSAGAWLLCPAVLFALLATRCRRYTPVGKELRADLRAFASALTRLPSQAEAAKRQQGDLDPDPAWAADLPLAVAMGLEAAYLRATAARFAADAPQASGLGDILGHMPDEGISAEHWHRAALSRIRALTAAIQAAILHAAARHGSFSVPRKSTVK